MRVIVNTIAIIIMVSVFIGFWALVLSIVKPRANRKWWIVYGLVMAALFIGNVVYIMYEVELYGTSVFPFLKLENTGSYGLVMGIFLAIPLLVIVKIVQWLVNRQVNQLDPAVGQSRRRLFQSAVVAAPVVTIGAAGYGAFIGQQEVVVTENKFTYKNLPPSLKNYKIVQLSDVHLGPSIDLQDLDELIELTVKQKPNRVIITGDLIDKVQWLPELCEALRKLAAQVPDGIDCILGNHEHFHDVHEILQAFKTKTPMRIYMNSNLEIFGAAHGAGQPVYIAGVDYDEKRSSKHRRVMLDEALKGIPENAFVILLAHHPEFMDLAFERNIPLTLAGHTHGGQIIFDGKMLVPLSTEYYKGIYTQGNSIGYVNSGTGHWFPIRFNCPREITVITFK